MIEFETSPFDIGWDAARGLLRRFKCGHWTRQPSTVGRYCYYVPVYLPLDFMAGPLPSLFGGN